MTKSVGSKYVWSDKMAAIRLAIHGAAGRMGKRLVALGSQDSSLATSLQRSNTPPSPALGQDAGLSAGVAALGRPADRQLGPTRHPIRHRFLVARGLHECGSQALHRLRHPARRRHHGTHTRTDRTSQSGWKQDSSLLGTEHVASR